MKLAPVGGLAAELPRVLHRSVSPEVVHRNVTLL